MLRTQGKQILSGIPILAQPGGYNGTFYRSPISESEHRWGTYRWTAAVKRSSEDGRRDPQRAKTGEAHLEKLCAWVSEPHPSAQGTGAALPLSTLGNVVFLRGWAANREMMTRVFLASLFHAACFIMVYKRRCDILHLTCSFRSTWRSGASWKYNIDITYYKVSV